MSSPLTPEQMAAARLRAALSDLEAAGAKLDDAAQALSALRGFVKLYEQIQDLKLGARAEWHALRQRTADPAELDHDEVTEYEAIRWGAGWIGPGTPQNP
jgi:site-specific recombinase XerC